MGSGEFDKTGAEAKVGVLVVDDSALMRKLIADMLASDPEIEIVGLARDGAEAVRMAEKLKPDVVTLDVEMPELSGLDALPIILANSDAAVIMVSAFTQEGAAVTLTALERGAIDFFAKPTDRQLSKLRENRDGLVAKVLAAAHSRSHRRSHKRRTPVVSTPYTPLESADKGDSVKIRLPSTAGSRILPAGVDVQGPAGCIVVGISTGGPQALSKILPKLQPNLPPILIVQHMPAQFTSVFAERLNRSCAIDVKEAEDAEIVVPNRILIAPGGKQMAIIGRPGTGTARVSIYDGLAVSGHKPSVDVLFRSAALVYSSSARGLIMTGMGRDGVEGCKAILAVGGLAFGQDEATSVVYGMNKAAFLEGGLSAQFALDDFPALVERLAKA